MQTIVLLSRELPGYRTRVSLTQPLNLPPISRCSRDVRSLLKRTNRGLCQGVIALRISFPAANGDVRVRGGLVWNQRDWSTRRSTHSRTNAVILVRVQGRGFEGPVSTTVGRGAATAVPSFCTTRTDCIIHTTLAVLACSVT